MQWLIDSVIEVWRALYPRVDKIELIAPDVDEIIRGDGDKWLGTPFRTVLGAYPRYVDRGSLPAADFTTVDFAQTGSWQTKSLVGIIPVGTLLVHCLLVVRANAVSSLASFSNWNHPGTWNVAQVRTQVADILFTSNILIEPNAGRLIDYFFDNLAFNYIALTIRGYWIK